MADEKKAKATMEARFNCPHCKEGIYIQQFKQRTSEPVPAEYKTWTEVQKDDQALLPGMEGSLKDPDTKVTKTKPKKKKQ